MEFATKDKETKLHKKSFVFLRSLVIDGEK